MSRFWKRFVLGGVVSLFALPLLGLIIERQVTRIRGERRLAAAMAALDAAEPGWQADPLCDARNRSLPPPEENAAEVALSATRRLPTSYKEWHKRANWRLELTELPARLPDENDVCEAVAVHDDCEEALAVARTVHKYPRGGFRLVYAYPNPYGTLLPHIVEVREAANLLDLDALILAYLGQGDEAVRSTHATLGVARGIGDELCLISQLNRIAIATVAGTSAERTLAWSEPTAGLAELQTAFAAEAVVNRLTPGLKGERASSFMLLDAMDDGVIGLNAIDGPGGSPTVGQRAGMIALRSTIPGQQAEMLDLFDRFIKADKLTGPARRAAIDAIVLPPRSLSNTFITLLMPAIHKIVEADDRARAHLGAAAVGLACERYRQRFGHWPADLAAIPKDILPAIPDDPYTGGPLRYTVLPDGVAVYATGPDKTDDGGLKLDTITTGKLGSDVGFRLWNPDKRRQPPKPKPPEDGGPEDADPPPPGGIV